MLNSGEVRYTPADGTPALKQAIIRYTEEFYGRPVTPWNVMASGGAKQAIMVALQAILNPQEEVIYPAPYWVSYPEMVKLCGAIRVPIYPEDGSFYPTIRDIDEKVGSYTKAVIINSPNNPSGAMYSERVHRRHRRVLREARALPHHGRHLSPADLRRPASRSTARISPRTRRRISKLIVINGVSKQYAMTGFRIGWAVANKKLIEVMTNIQSHQTSGPSALLQHAAVGGAGNGLQSGVESLRVTVGEQPQRADGRSGWRPSTGVRVTKPDGTFYCFADFSHYNKNSTKLAGVPPRQGAGGHRSGRRVRDGRLPAAVYLRHDQGHHRGHRADEVGARSERAQRALHR